jgi:hypothetical protein
MSDPRKLGLDARPISLRYPCQTPVSRVLTQDPRLRGSNAKPKRIIIIIQIIIFLISITLIIIKIRIFIIQIRIFLFY